MWPTAGEQEAVPSLWAPMRADVNWACCPLLSLSSSGSGAAHAERPPSLQSGAGAGQCYTAVCGQWGLPLRLEAWLEGGGQQQVWGGVR